MRAVLYLFNGGLSASASDRTRLRETRSVSVMSMLMVAISVIVLVKNVFSGHWVDVGMMIPLGTLSALALALLPVLRRPRWTAQIVLSAGIATLIVLMSDSGLSGFAWMWLLVSPLFATLLGGPLSGVVWTLVVLVLLRAFEWAHRAGVQFVNPGTTDWEKVVGEGTLLTICLALVGLGFAMMQRWAERGTEASINELEAEVAVRTRTEELAREAATKAELAAERAKAAEAVKDVFVATVSHELRTPMNGVLGAAEILTHTGLTEEQQELVSTVRDSGQLLLDLVEELLHLQRLQAGALPVEPEDVVLTELIDGVRRSMQPLATAQGIDLELRVSERVPKVVRLDPRRVRKVLTNLVGNALKFTDEGSVCLGASIDDGHLHLFVEDTGVGIAAHALDRIFEPFVQADAYASRRFGGTGLGLSIVRRSAHEMGGQVQVRSTQGVGSTFTVTIPLVRGTLASTPTPQPDADVSGVRVLVVDDNAVNRRIACHMLDRLGCVCDQAASGAEALLRISREPWDMVLMDVQMPGMDGYEATRRIRAEEGPPVVGLSANVTDEDRQAGERAGMVSYLSKPVQVDGLRQAVGAHARRAREPEPDVGSAYGPEAAVVR